MNHLRLYAASVAAFLGVAARAESVLDAAEEGRIADLLKESGAPSVSVAVVEHGESAAADHG